MGDVSLHAWFPGPSRNQSVQEVPSGGGASCGSGAGQPGGRCWGESTAQHRGIGHCTVLRWGESLGLSCWWGWDADIKTGLNWVTSCCCCRSRASKQRDVCTEIQGYPRVVFAQHIPHAIAGGFERHRHCFRISWWSSSCGGKICLLHDSLGPIPSLCFPKASRGVVVGRRVWVCSSCQPHSIWIAGCCGLGLKRVLCERAPQGREGRVQGRLKVRLWRLWEVAFENLEYFPLGARLSRVQSTLVV